VISIAYVDEGGAVGEKKGERMETQEGYEAPGQAVFYIERRGRAITLKDVVGCCPVLSCHLAIFEIHHCCFLNVLKAELLEIVVNRIRVEIVISFLNVTEDAYERVLDYTTTNQQACPSKSLFTAMTPVLVLTSRPWLCPSGLMLLPPLSDWMYLSPFPPSSLHPSFMAKKASKTCCFCSGVVLDLYPK